MRQFLAVPLPDELLGTIACVRADLGNPPGWRWARPESIHLTLRFLGDVDTRTDTGARAAWREATAGTPPRIRLGLSGIEVFPAPARPRVLVLAVREIEPGGALGALAARLEGAARTLGFAAEHRPFRPHLTLARAARGQRPQVPPADASAPTGAFDAEAVRLYRSELLPSGARYTVLDSFAFARR